MRSNKSNAKGLSFTGDTILILFFPKRNLTTCGEHKQKIEEAGT